MACAARANAVDILLRDRDNFLAELRACLLQAQQYTKHHCDDHHRDLRICSGRLGVTASPAPSRTLVGASTERQAERVGQVAYKLRLPEDIKLHDIFHVGLKPFRGDPPAAPPPVPSRNTCCVLNSVRARATSRRYLEAPDDVPRPLPQCLARG